MDDGDPDAMEPLSGLLHRLLKPGQVFTEQYKPDWQQERTDERDRDKHTTKQYGYGSWGPEPMTGWFEEPTKHLAQ
jgi:hypothetical protein